MLKLILRKFHLYPLYAIMMIGFIGFHPFAERGSRVPLALHTDPTKQIVLSFLYVCSFLLLYQKKNKLELLTAWGPYLIFLLYAMLSCFWSVDPIKVVKDVANMIGMMAIVSLLVTDKDRLFLLLGIIALVAFLINLFSFVTIIAGYEPALDQAIGRWQGVCIHPNYLGIAGFLGIFSFIAFQQYHRKQYNTFIIFAGAALAVCNLYFSASMTSIMLSSLVVIFFLSRHIIYRIHPQTLPVMLLNLVLASGILLSVSMLLFPKQISINSFFSMFDRNTTFTGRTILWRMGLQAIKKSPWVGWGYDGLLSAQKYSFKGALDYYQLHNGYINLTVETGIIGLFLLFVVIFLCMRHIYSNEYIYKEKVLLYVLIVAILIHNMTESSFFSSGNILWIILSSIFIINSRPQKTANKCGVCLWKKGDRVSLISSF